VPCWCIQCGHDVDELDVVLLVGVDAGRRIVVCGACVDGTA